MNKLIVLALTALSLAACAGPYYDNSPRHDGYYRDGYYRPAPVAPSYSSERGPGGYYYYQDGYGNSGWAR